jgi:formylglycine-generating enzyme required for sulfatase activity
MKHISSLELMPKPFDWVDIPAGQVTFGDHASAKGGYVTQAMTFDVPAFAIAKYPVTNAQFAKFIEAGGYHQPKWWTKKGWQMREVEGWVEPGGWKHVEPNMMDHPVVWVSWYEAIAFCRWLSDVTREKISLPTEQQWQRAAQGDTQWAYPYGDQLDENRANFRRAKTTSVTQYEGGDKGDSPFGVVDMIGNVWEWCLTKFGVNSNHLGGMGWRVLRGASSWDTLIHLHVESRNDYGVAGRVDAFGFRIARN